MRNSGFVTDSDTERELRKWQQARDMPIDAEKIRQQYKNACMGLVMSPAAICEHWKADDSKFLHMLF